MKQRCLNQRTVGWKYYGKRGITVCERWLGKAGFRNFYDDMAPTWQPSLTLDRINNEGNYEPTNCRWATMSQQAENKRHHVNPNSLRQRAIRAGLDYRVVVNRVYYLGWTEERALTTPKLPRGAQIGHRNYHVEVVPVI